MNRFNSISRNRLGAADAGVEKDIVMDVTRKHFSNTEAGKMFGREPMYTFTHARTFPPATFRGATHPNFDTLYSLGWLDLTKERVVISVPDTQAAGTCCRWLTCGRIRSLGWGSARPA